MADRAVKGTAFRAAGEEETKQNLSCSSPITVSSGVTCGDVFTCDDVLDGSILSFVNMATVFSLFSSELCEKLLLLPLAPVGGRLEKEGGRGGVGSRL